MGIARQPAETRAVTRHELRRECNLGNEHDDAASVLSRTRNRSQIHLGFARSRDAVKQERFGCEALERTLDCGGGVRVQMPQRQAIELIGKFQQVIPKRSRKLVAAVFGSAPMAAHR